MSDEPGPSVTALSQSVVSDLSAAVTAIQKQQDRLLDTLLASQTSSSSGPSQIRSRVSSQDAGSEGWFVWLFEVCMLYCIPVCICCDVFWMLNSCVVVSLFVNSLCHIELYSPYPFRTLFSEPVFCFFVSHCIP